MDYFPVQNRLILERLKKPRGRPRLLDNEAVAHVHYLYHNELLTLREIGDILGINHMTVWRALRNLENGKGNAGGNGKGNGIC